jgi:hypothetical protein
MSTRGVHSRVVFGGRPDLAPRRGWVMCQHVAHIDTRALTLDPT